MFLTFLFVNSNYGLKEILNSNYISSDLIITIAIIVYSLISMSFFLNKFKIATSILCIGSILVINCCFMDTKFSQWSKLKVNFWTQLGLIADNICIIIGFFYIFMFENFKNKAE